MAVTGFNGQTRFDVYNNQFIGNSVPNYPGSQHQDGYQSDGQYSRVWNNTFLDLGNYGVFLNAFGNVSDFQVFNNVAYMNDSLFIGGGQQFMYVGSFASGTITFQRIVAFNNTIANYTGAPGINFVAGSGSIFDTSDVIEDNLLYNVNGGVQAAPNVVNNNNQVLATGGSTLFAAYQPMTSTAYSYDFHVPSTAASLLGQGLNLTSVGISELDADHDGVARPTSGGWGIGAYQYGGGGTVQSLVPPPTLVVSVQ